MVHILIVEEKQSLAAIISKRLHHHENTIETVKSIDMILDKFHDKTYDILIWQTSIAKQDKRNGVEILEVLSQDSPRTQIICISDEQDKDLAIEGIQAGAFQYMIRPINDDELIALIELALDKQPSYGENILLHTYANTPTNFHDIYSVSKPMASVINQIQEAARTDISVLITGETGTGKDVVASAIHRASEISDKPYVVVHTGVMPTDLIASELFGYDKGAFTGAHEATQGKFEQADNGTIFLDEIGTMDNKAQISLLRILENQSFQRLGGRKKIKVSVRVIAATNEDLEMAVSNKQFREDLYYRLNVFNIHLPPLRKRPGDISFLTKHFIAQFNQKYDKSVTDVSSESWHFLERYNWPGNVRELKNVIQRAVLLAKGTQLSPDLLPERILDEDLDSFSPKTPNPIYPGLSLAEVEKEFISMTLHFCKHNKSKTAQLLKISRKALYEKMKRFGLF